MFSQTLECFPESLQQCFRDEREGQLPLGEFLSKIGIWDLDSVLEILESNGTEEEIMETKDIDAQSSVSADTDASRSVDETESVESSTCVNDARYDYFISLKQLVHPFPTISLLFLMFGFGKRLLFPYPKPFRCLRSYQVNLRQEELTTLSTGLLGGYLLAKLT